MLWGLRSHPMNALNHFMNAPIENLILITLIENALNNLIILENGVHYFITQYAILLANIEKL